MARTVLTTMPGSAPCQRLQVALEQADGGPLVIELSEQHYAEGIGWFTQRSMSLDAGQWRQLRSVLGAGRMPEMIDESPSEVPATVPFPGPRSQDPPFRSAVGDGAN